jgi:CubicO group peptidase (beta-lactamase class C family)
MNISQVMSELKVILDTHIESKTFPGCVVGIVEKNGTKTLVSSGNHTYSPNSPQMSSDSMFDVASVTKSIPTSSIALKLIEDNVIHSEDLVVQYVPDLKNNYSHLLKVEHLLTQTVTFDLSLSSLKEHAPDEIIRLILTKDFLSPPGSKYYYTNSTSVLLTILINKITGKSVDALGEELFFRPLEMNNTTFHPEKFEKDLIVPTEFDSWRKKLIHGEVHDEGAYALGKQYKMGHAGLFSTVPDLLKFLEMLLNNGLMISQQYFKPETIKKMYTVATTETEQKTSMGWEIGCDSLWGNLDSPKTFGKTGFTGCLVVCNLEKEIGVVILSNRIHPYRPSNANSINKARKAICDCIANHI